MLFWVKENWKWKCKIFKEITVLPTIFLLIEFFAIELSVIDKAISNSKRQTLIHSFLRKIIDFQIKFCPYETYFYGRTIEVWAKKCVFFSSNFRHERFLMCFHCALCVACPKKRWLAFFFVVYSFWNVPFSSQFCLNIARIIRQWSGH